ncbi:hypothetical protein D3C75_934920 [compost metagenome]
MNGYRLSPLHLNRHTDAVHQLPEAAGAAEQLQYFFVFHTARQPGFVNQLPALQVDFLGMFAVIAGCRLYTRFVHQKQAAPFGSRVFWRRGAASLPVLRYEPILPAHACRLLSH